MAYKDLRQWRFLSVVIGLVVFLSGCRGRHGLTRQPVRQTEFLMDTVVSIEVYAHPESTATIWAAFAEIKRV